MKNRYATYLPFLLTAAVLATANPSEAQGKGKGNAKNDRGNAERVETRKGNDRPELLRRDADDDRYEDVYDDRTSRRDVPKGWCQGKGNPHNTVENCGYGSDRIDGISANRRTGSYAEQHDAFHRSLDRKYSVLASDRPLDVRRQIELRAQKSAEHQRWHDRVGQSHQ